jgi:preprotein translocase subunit SecE
MFKNLNAYKFLDQVKQEVKKVIWPVKKELVTSVAVVAVAVMLFSLVCMLLDYSIHSLIQLLLGI